MQILAAGRVRLQQVLLDNNEHVGPPAAHTQVRATKSVDAVLFSWSHFPNMKVVRWKGEKVDLLLSCEAPIAHRTIWQRIGDRKVTFSRWMGLRWMPHST